jgi:hypothetical protein
VIRAKINFLYCFFICVHVYCGFIPFDRTILLLQFQKAVSSSIRCCKKRQHQLLQEAAASAVARSSIRFQKKHHQLLQGAAASAVARSSVSCCKKHHQLLQESASMSQTATLLEGQSTTKTKRFKVKHPKRKLFRASDPLLSVFMWGVNHSVRELQHVHAPVMLMPDDFRSFSKVKVDNNAFNKENLPSHFKAVFCILNNERRKKERSLFIFFSHIHYYREIIAGTFLIIHG